MSTEREQPVDLLAALLESIRRRTDQPPAEPAAPTHESESDDVKEPRDGIEPEC